MKLRSQAIGLLVGYGVQFIAGMVLNLYVAVPAAHPGAQASDYLSGVVCGLVWALSGRGGVALAAHAYVALGLTLGALSLCYHAIRARSRVWTIAGIVAAVFTLGALLHGLSFINYDHDSSSLAMALSWLVSVAAVITGIVLTGLPGKRSIR